MTKLVLCSASSTLVCALLFRSKSVCTCRLAVSNATYVRRRRSKSTSGSMKNSRFHVDEMSNSITKYNRKLVVNILCSVALSLDWCMFLFICVVGSGDHKLGADRPLPAAVNVNVACWRTPLGIKRRSTMCLTVTRD